MKLVSFENLLKYNELLNQKTVRSVNSVKPDSNGNVDITIPEVDLSGLVKSVNSITPDADGNVNISSNVTNIVGVTNNRNLGEIFYSALPLESSQVHSLDGSVLTDATELYDYLESIKDSNPDLFTTDSEFNSEVETTGKCSKFVINADAKSVRIPKGDSNNYIVIKNYDTKFEFNQPFSLLEPKWSDVPLNNPSWLLSNGQINSSENYPSVYELLLNEYNNGTLKSETVGDVVISYKQLDNGHKIVTDKTSYNSILKNTGTAWYYLLDLDSRTFVLPQTNGFMKYGNSNQFIKQSLPNIKGQYSINDDWCSIYSGAESGARFKGAFTKAPTISSNKYRSSYLKGGSGYDLAIDASRSSDIYADGANVNPNAVQGYLYFYVGDCVGTSNSVNLGNIKDKLDLEVTNINKTISELKTDTVESMSLGTKGYIRYKNGIQMCWDSGESSAFTMNKTLTFIKPFYDTNYVLIGVSFLVVNYSNQIVVSRTTTSFTTISDANNAGTCSYLAIGRWK